MTRANSGAPGWFKDPAEVLGGLGPEPLDDLLTPDTFFEMLHSRSRQLKPLLMDQSFIAGLGNIYTDEALHLAKLHPLAVSDQITQEASARLLARHPGGAGRRHPAQRREHRLGVPRRRLSELFQRLWARGQPLPDLRHPHRTAGGWAARHAHLPELPENRLMLL